MPGPRFSRNFSRPALPAGLMSSMLESPIGSSAASVFCVSTVSRTFTPSPSTSRKRAMAPSISLTAMATWSIFLMRIIDLLISRSVPRSKHRRYILKVAMLLSLRRLALLLLVLAACSSESPVLELTITADRQPQTLDVLVRDQDAGTKILSMTGQQVPAKDLTKVGAKVVIYFSRPGRYLVHVAGRNQGLPAEVSTHVYSIAGHATAAQHLVPMADGADGDGDTFAACPQGTPAP